MWFNLYEVSKVIKLIEAESITVISRSYREVKWRLLFNGYRVSGYAKWESSRDQPYNIVHIVNNNVHFKTWE